MSRRFTNRDVAADKCASQTGATGGVALRQQRDVASLWSGGYAVDEHHSPQIWQQQSEGGSRVR